jgi:hypothetical protein
MRVAELIDALSKVKDSDAIVRCEGLDVTWVEMYKAKSGNVICFLSCEDEEDALEVYPTKGEKHERLVDRVVEEILAQ